MSVKVVKFKICHFKTLIASNAQNKTMHKRNHIGNYSMYTYLEACVLIYRAVYVTFIKYSLQVNFPGLYGLSRST